jgi:hypothetical protein
VIVMIDCAGFFFSSVFFNAVRLWFVKIEIGV